MNESQLKDRIRGYEIAFQKVNYAVTMKAKVYSYKTGKAKLEGVRTRARGSMVELAGECKVDLGKTLHQASKRRKKS